MFIGLCSNSKYYKVDISFRPTWRIFSYSFYLLQSFLEFSLYVTLLISVVEKKTKQQLQQNLWKKISCF